MLSVLQQEGKDFNLTHNKKVEKNKDALTLTVSLTQYTKGLKHVSNFIFNKANQCKPILTSTQFT